MVATTLTSSSPCPTCGGELKCYCTDVGGIVEDFQYSLACGQCGLLQRESKYGGDPCFNDINNLPDTTCPYCGQAVGAHKETPAEFRGFPVKPITPAEESAVTSGPYGWHLPMDINVVLKEAEERLVGGYVWYEWRLPDQPSEGADVLVHRIASVHIDVDPAGVDNLVYRIPHGDQDTRTIESWRMSGCPMPRAETDAPRGRTLCPICFPNGLPPAADNLEKTG